MVTAVAASFVVVPAEVLSGSDGGAATAAQHAMMAAGAQTEEEVQHFAQAREQARANPLAHAFLPQFVAVGRRLEWTLNSTTARLGGPNQPSPY